MVNLSKIKFWLISIYFVSILCSIAVMETASTLIFVLAIFEWIRSILKNNKMNFQKEPYLDGSLVLFFLLVVFGAFFLVTSNGRVEVLGYVRWVLLFFALRTVFNFRITEIDNFKLLVVLTTLSTLLFIVSFLQTFYALDLIHPGRNLLHSTVDGDANSLKRAVGAFSMPLTFAAVIGGFAFLFLGFLMESFDTLGKRKWLVAFSSISCFLSLILTFSRGAWIGAFASIIVIFFIKKKIWGSMIAVSMVGVAVIMMTFSQDFRSRILSVAQTQNVSNQARIKIWQANYKMIQDYPFFGVGLGQNQNYLSTYYQKLGYRNETFFSHAHNNYIQVLAGTGIFGFLLFLFITKYFLWLAYTNYKRIRNKNSVLASISLGSLGALLFLYISGITETNFFDTEVNHLYIFLWAILLLVKRSEYKELPT